MESICSTLKNMLEDLDSTVHKRLIDNPQGPLQLPQGYPQAQSQE